MEKKFATTAGLLVTGSLLLISLLIAPALGAEAYPLSHDDAKITQALDYLKAEQLSDGSIGDFSNSAWIVMAIAAASEDPHEWQIGTNPSIVDYLAVNAAGVASSTDYAQLLLAVTAAGEEPTDFGSQDLVALLQSTYDGTQIGDANMLNDDFFGVMGLVAAGDSAQLEIIADSVDFIKVNQGSDGGWSWGVGQDSDVDMTASAIMALVAAGESQSSPAITDALAYIKSTQMENGGFMSWGVTNADTNSWAICGIMAAGQDPNGADWTSRTGNTPLDNLLSFQQDNGQFYFQDENPGFWPLQTTAYTITALLGKHYPVSSYLGVSEADPANDNTALLVSISVLAILAITFLIWRRRRAL
jgi:hypothetical protein